MNVWVSFDYFVVGVFPEEHVKMCRWICRTTSSLSFSMFLAVFDYRCLKLSVVCILGPLSNMFIFL